MSSNDSYPLIKVVYTYTKYYWLDLTFKIESIESVKNDLFSFESDLHENVSFSGINEPQHGVEDYCMLFTINKSYFDAELNFSLLEEIIAMTDMPAVMYNDILSALNEEQFRNKSSFIEIVHHLSHTSVRLTNLLQAGTKQISYRD